MCLNAEGPKAGINLQLLTRKNPIKSVNASKGSDALIEGDVPKEGEFSFSFKREERLKRKKEIREVFDKGRRLACRGAKLYLLENELSRNRICFTFSRGFGNAVERNRARRLGREAYRNLKPRLRQGYDLILLVYPDDPAPVFAWRMKQLEHLLTKAGLFL